MLKNASQLKGKFEFYESFEDAAKRVVELAGGGGNNEQVKKVKECCGR